MFDPDPKSPPDRIVSAFDASASSGECWADTLAALPPPPDLGPHTRWWQHPRARRPAPHPPAFPCSPPRSRRRCRRKYRPRIRLTDDTPLALSRALTAIKFLSLGHYSGPFPTTNAEFTRIQEFRDAELRGRSPLRRPYEWFAGSCWKYAWRNQPIVGEGVRGAMNQLLRYWGWDGGEVRWNWEFAGVVEALVQMSDEQEESDGESGYTGSSESQGGKEGGCWGWYDDGDDDAVYTPFPPRLREGIGDEETSELTMGSEEEEDGERYVYLQDGSRTPGLRPVLSSPPGNWGFATVAQIEREHDGYRSALGREVVYHDRRYQSESGLFGLQRDRGRN